MPEARAKFWRKKNPGPATNLIENTTPFTGVVFSFWWKAGLKSIFKKQKPPLGVASYSLRFGLSAEPIVQIKQSEFFGAKV